MQFSKKKRQETIEQLSEAIQEIENSKQVPRRLSGSQLQEIAKHHRAIYKAEHPFKTSAKRLAAVGAIVVAGYMLFSPDKLDVQHIPVDVWGRPTTERTKAGMNKEAFKKYELAKDAASASELFALRYTDTATVDVKLRDEAGEGIRGLFDYNPVDDAKRVFKYRDGCLNDTAYDINGGTLHFTVNYNGFFSSVYASASGDVPTAAAQASLNPNTDVLTIRSGNTRPADLKFKMQGVELEPVNKATQNILETYGCDREVNASYSDTDY